MSTARISGHFVLLLLVAPLLGGAACERKQTTDTGAVSAADRATGPVDTAPLPGIDASKLDAAKQKLFFTLVGSLASPCGKAESLRKAMTDDKTCKRAPYAVRYVLALVDDEISEASLREAYREKYEKPPVTIDLKRAPRLGNEDALVRIVEFYDYGCPHCKELKPVLDGLLEEHRDKLAAYFLMFPLGNWKDSPSAAQASIAAAQQGKFKEMHALLFERAPAHSREAVMGYAKEIGLDLDKFTAAYDAAGGQVASDRAQGEGVNVDTTPTLFVNGRRFTVPWKYLGQWIEEEAAVNR